MALFWPLWHNIITYLFNCQSHPHPLCNGDIFHKRNYASGIIYLWYWDHYDILLIIVINTPVTTSLQIYLLWNVQKQLYHCIGCSLMTDLRNGVLLIIGLWLFELSDSMESIEISWFHLLVCLTGKQGPWQLSIQICSSLFIPIKANSQWFLTATVSKGLNK